MSHTEAQLRAMYETLKSKHDGEQRAGYRLGVLPPRSRLSDNYAGQAGGFKAYPPANPAWEGPSQAAVWIHRDHSQIAGDALEELLTLAHELGHWRSFCDGNHTPTYQAAVFAPYYQWPTLGLDAKRAIFAEESRAWDNARTILAEVGFQNAAAFEGRRAWSLDDYRERLALEDVGLGNRV